MTPAQALRGIATETARALLTQMPGWASRPGLWLAAAEAGLKAAADEVPPGPDRDAVREMHAATLDMLKRFVPAAAARDVDVLLTMTDLWPEEIARAIEAAAVATLADAGVKVTEVRTTDGEKLFRLEGLEGSGFDIAALDTDEIAPVAGPVHRVH